MNEGLFKEQGLDAHQGGEKTDSYPKVSRPPVAILVIATLILIASILSWSFLAEIPVRHAAVGVVADGTIRVLVSPDEISGLDTRAEVLIDGNYHTVESVSADTLSSQQVRTIFGDEDSAQLKPSAENIIITADAAGVADGVKTIFVVTGKQRPIDSLEVTL
jgi:hypothetical protein